MSGPARVAILAALPREVRGLIGRVKPDSTLLGKGIHFYSLSTAIVVAAGMGASRVSVAFEAALACGGVETVVSTGLAGACTAALPEGAVAEAGQIVDARTGERFSTAAAEAGPVLVTTDAIAGIHEKGRLASAYGAGMVDMEAAAVARLAAAHGLAFRAIKGISDAHDFELASLARFGGAHGQFRTAAFALHTALRPHHWTRAAALGRGSNRALSALHARLREIVSASSAIPASNQP